MKIQNTFWKGLYGPLLIAEIGGNHEGDFEKGKNIHKIGNSIGCRLH